MSLGQEDRLVLVGGENHDAENLGHGKVVLERSSCVYSCGWGCAKVGTQRRAKIKGLPEANRENKGLFH
jgi:hypothetical protein